jgi:ABC-type transporter Mla subunit MlaD
MDDDKVRYSDLIEPDDSFEKLIKQLSEVSKAYASTITDIKSVAADLATALKKVSGATKEGKDSISSATSLADRLKKAQEELCNALTATGQQIAYVKSVTSEVNRASATYGKELNSLLGSHDQLTAALKRLTTEFKS